MALRVWLPLIRDINNQGISKLTFKNTNTANTTNVTGGKLGKCYQNNSNTAGGLVSNETISLGQNQSMFCWVKMNSFYSSSSLTGIGGQHRYSSNCGMGITMRYASATTGYLSVNTGNGSSRTYNTYYGQTLLNAGTWYHVGYTYDGSTIRLYVNGKLDKEQAYSGMSVPADYICIFAWSLSSTSGNAIWDNHHLNGMINDFRIYDHTLSQKEISELAKGMVCHYRLDNYGCGMPNLYDGNTSAYASYWTLQSYSKSNIVLKSARAVSGNTVALQIPFALNNINQNDICVMSCYLYKNGLPYKTNPQINSTYTSDYQLIESNSFDNGFFYTKFKKLSAKGSGTWIIHTPLFGNTTTTDIGEIRYLKIEKADSATPFYTCPTYAINSGTTEFSGTVPSSSCSDFKSWGGIVIYPDDIYLLEFEAKASSNGVVLTNYLYNNTSGHVQTQVKTGSVTGNLGTSTDGSYNVSLTTSYANYWMCTKFTSTGIVSVKTLLFRLIQSNNTSYVGATATIKNVRLRKLDVESDCSGHGYNGYLLGNHYVNSKSARYCSSYIFDRIANNRFLDMTVIDFTGIANSYTIAFFARCTDVVNRMPFGFSDGNRLNLYTTNGIYCLNTGDGGSNPFKNGSTNVSCSSHNDNKWRHYAIVGNGSNARLFIDGIYAGTATTYKAITGTHIFLSGWANNVDYKWIGSISDFRIYGTAISDADILELAKTSASIDKTGKVYCYNYIEE